MDKLWYFLCRASLYFLPLFPYLRSVHSQLCSLATGPGALKSQNIVPLSMRYLTLIDVADELSTYAWKTQFSIDLDNITRNHAGRRRHILRSYATRHLPSITPLTLRPGPGTLTLYPKLGRVLSFCPPQLTLSFRIHVLLDCIQQGKIYSLYIGSTTISVFSPTYFYTLSVSVSCLCRYPASASPGVVTPPVLPLSSSAFEVLSLTCIALNFVLEMYFFAVCINAISCPEDHPSFSVFHPFQSTDAEPHATQAVTRATSPANTYPRAHFVDQSTSKNHFGM